MQISHLDLESLDKLEKRTRAHLVNSLSGFKSANLVGTKSKTGETNLSIISSAFHLGADPALMGFIIRPDISPRHTLENIRENSYLTLNHINSNIVDQAHQTSARYPREISEFTACELQEEYLGDFPAPYVREASIKMGLQMVSERLLVENNTIFVIAKILHIYFPKDCWDESGPLDIVKAKTVSVSGLDTYHEGLKIKRLSYAKQDQKLSEI